MLNRTGASWMAAHCCEAQTIDGVPHWCYLSRWHQHDTHYDEFLDVQWVQTEPKPARLVSVG